MSYLAPLLSSPHAATTWAIGFTHLGWGPSGEAPTARQQTNGKQGHKTVMGSDNTISKQKRKLRAQVKDDRDCVYRTAHVAPISKLLSCPNIKTTITITSVCQHSQHNPPQPIPKGARPLTSKSANGKVKD
ncbi:hypothetical protein Vafri_12244 [Volvox africanus]|uniref:Uncharacterized protein n=1 Tax=Volvox africanus TaxID=51714 RepID=A0A8J4B9M1_9CHLO|nr:hypothetical protein Vafri_12244 [Volvox africanus]